MISEFTHFINSSLRGEGQLDCNKNMCFRLCLIPLILYVVLVLSGEILLNKMGIENRPFGLNSGVMLFLVYLLPIPYALASIYLPQFMRFFVFNKFIVKQTFMDIVKQSYCWSVPIALLFTLPSFLLFFWALGIKCFFSDITGLMISAMVFVVSGYFKNKTLKKSFNRQFGFLGNVSDMKNKGMISTENRSRFYRTFAFVMLVLLILVLYALDVYGHDNSAFQKNLEEYKEHKFVYIYLKAFGAYLILMMIATIFMSIRIAATAEKAKRDYVRLDFNEFVKRLKSYSDLGLFKLHIDINNEKHEHRVVIREELAGRNLLDAGNDDKDFKQLQKDETVSPAGEGYLKVCLYDKFIYVRDMSLMAIEYIIRLENVTKVILKNKRFMQYNKVLWVYYKDNKRKKRIILCSDQFDAWIDHMRKCNIEFQDET